MESNGSDAVRRAEMREPAMRNYEPMPQARMWVICAWCQPGVKGPMISHTMCRWHSFLLYPPVGLGWLARWLRGRGWT
jgi:hypothetical protein